VTAPDDLPDHVRRNRTEWDAWALEYVEGGEVCSGYPALGAMTTFPFATLECASQWPSEEVWKARMRG
jgi:hypothetical protein